jgi:hypothetical protein
VMVVSMVVVSMVVVGVVVVGMVVVCVVVVVVVVVGFVVVGVVVVVAVVVDAVMSNDGGPTHTNRTTSAATLSAICSVLMYTPAPAAHGSEYNPSDKNVMFDGCTFWFTRTRAVPLL